MKSTPGNKLQLVGAAALLIASKYEELRSLRVTKLVYVTDNIYTKAEIIAMEKHILKVS